MLYLGLNPGKKALLGRLCASLAQLIASRYEIRDIIPLSRSPVLLTQAFARLGWRETGSGSRLAHTSLLSPSVAISAASIGGDVHSWHTGLQCRSVHDRSDALMPLVLL